MVDGLTVCERRIEAEGNANRLARDIATIAVAGRAIPHDLLAAYDEAATEVVAVHAAEAAQIRAWGVSR